MTSEGLSPFRPSDLTIIPNTKRHPDHIETGQFPIVGVITSLPRPYHNLSKTQVRILKKRYPTCKKNLSPSRNGNSSG